MNKSISIRQALISAVTLIIAAFSGLTYAQENEDTADVYKQIPQTGSRIDRILVVGSRVGAHDQNSQTDAEGDSDVPSVTPDADDLHKQLVEFAENGLGD